MLRCIGLVLAILLCGLVSPVLYSAPSNSQPQNPARLLQLSRWLQRMIPGGSEIVRANGVDVDTISYALTIRLHMSGQESIAIALLVSQRASDSMYRLVRSPSAEIIASEQYLSVLCSVMIGDVDYIAPYDSLSTTMPYSILLQMMRADTSAAALPFRCDLATFNAVSVALYDVDKQQQRLFYVDSHPVYKSRPLDEATCLSFQRAVDHIVTATMLPILSRTYRHERTAILKSPKPFPKFDGPPIEILPPKK